MKMKGEFAMVGCQIAFTLQYFFTQASFKHGMDPSLYVTYRHLLAALILLPLAYFFERKSRPKLTKALFLEIFVLSLLGVSLTLNMFFKSMMYTSPTFLACIFNTISSLTFIIAALLRLESVNIRSLRGMAKVLGAMVSLGGVMVITLYKGTSLPNIGYKAPLHMNHNITLQQNWLLGSILAVACCITWSMWYIMQAYTLKRYPAQLSLTTWVNLVGGTQSAVFTAIAQHEPHAWTIGLDIGLWSTLYGGVVISGFVYFAQLWCIKARGPVFITMFSPLTTLLVAILSYFALGEKLYIGSIVGGVIVILGLYTFLWGKQHDGDESRNNLKKITILEEDSKCADQTV